MVYMASTSQKLLREKSGQNYIQRKSCANNNKKSQKREFIIGRSQTCIKNTKMCTTNYSARKGALKNYQVACLLLSSKNTKHVLKNNFNFIYARPRITKHVQKSQHQDFGLIRTSPEINLHSRYNIYDDKG